VKVKSRHLQPLGLDSDLHDEVNMFPSDSSEFQNISSLVLLWILLIVDRIKVTHCEKLSFNSFLSFTVDASVQCARYLQLLSKLTRFILARDIN
jgi:hypothetical protein